MLGNSRVFTQAYTDAWCVFVFCFCFWVGVKECCWLRGGGLTTRLSIRPTRSPSFPTALEGGEKDVLYSYFSYFFIFLFDFCSSFENPAGRHQKSPSSYVICNGPTSIIVSKVTDIYVYIRHPRPLSSSDGHHICLILLQNDWNRESLESSTSIHFFNPHISVFVFLFQNWINGKLTTLTHLMMRGDGWREGQVMKKYQNFKKRKRRSHEWTLKQWRQQFQPRDAL